MWIAIDGPDGTGKSTQVVMLAAGLRKAGKKVLMVVEPSREPIGETIRALAASNAGYPALAEAMLFTADRYQQVTKTIVPAVIGGAIVVGDRSILSSLAYQKGRDPCVGEEFMDRLIHVDYKLRSPDLIILLDATWGTASRRIRTRGLKSDELESRALADYAEIRRRYLAEAAAMPGWVTAPFGAKSAVIDANGTVGDIAGRIRKVVGEFLRIPAGKLWPIVDR